MQEPTASRSLGSDGTWPAWPRAVDRPAPQSDVARLDPARGTPVDQPPAPFGVEDAGKSTAERLMEASFPRTYARFEMNKETQRLCIKIVDAATDEVVREIPS